MSRLNLRLPGSDAAAEKPPKVVLNPSCGGRIEELCLQPGPAAPAVPLLQPERIPESMPENVPPAGSSRQQEEQPHSGAPGPVQQCQTEGFNGHILLPFNDRIPGGLYRWGGEDYRLPVNDPAGNDALHGLLYALPMKVETVDIEAKAARAILSRSLSPSESPGYPFSLFVRMTCSLYPDSFQLDIEVRNRGNSPAPCALGWHPYFRLPGDNGEPLPIDELQLRMPADYYVAVDEALLPTGEYPPVAGSSYDFRIIRAIASTEMDVALHKAGNPVLLSGGGLTLEVRSSPLFTYWQVFTPEDRCSIAIEPVSAATNSFNHPELGLRTLTPSASIHGRIQVQLART